MIQREEFLPPTPGYKFDQMPPDPFRYEGPDPHCNDVPIGPYSLTEVGPGPLGGWERTDPHNAAVVEYDPEPWPPGGLREIGPGPHSLHSSDKVEVGPDLYVEAASSVPVQIPPGPLIRGEVAPPAKEQDMPPGPYRFGDVLPHTHN
ncbi:hypothetical protein C7459_102290 [Tumebacillus permanentifrigoris]|uniref:Uncharacterized protein n=1 Tax=Tumebacillus permanentifrigoris TaxID=378543 RepID=A0A316DHG6_9BACL|nr:hypothetical protein C7459_102290 [Tumebacillus permanentifrigoris]